MLCTILETTAWPNRPELQSKWCYLALQIRERQTKAIWKLADGQKENNQIVSDHIEWWKVLKSTERPRNPNHAKEGEMKEHVNAENRMLVNFLPCGILWSNLHTAIIGKFRRNSLYGIRVNNQNISVWCKNYRTCSFFISCLVAALSRVAGTLISSMKSRLNVMILVFRAKIRA